ncbi:CotH kinase family protein [Maribellus maritimus]|nr:CotH kinase family protein [Maribellus maritimus]
MRFFSSISVSFFIYLIFFNSLKIKAQNTDFSTDLPLIIINTNGQEIVDEPKITATLKIISNANGINRATDAPTGYNGRIGIEVRGSSSQYYPQRPFLFETRDENGENLNVSILGLPEENDWILLSNYNDKSFMRNILGYKLFELSGHYAPRAKLVDVIINNTYEGIYVLTEKIKQDKNRVDIAKLKPSDNAGDEVTGGYIFKIDYWNENDSWKSPYSPIDHPAFEVHFVYHDPDWEELSFQQKDYIKNYVTSFETALYGPDFKNLQKGYPNFIDEESFIDYFIVSEISRNNDGFKKSRYFHKDKNGKIAAGPVWDFDWAWKNINECFIFKATNGSGWSYKINDCNPWVKSPGWMIQLFDDFYFRQKTNCRYFHLRETVLSNENILGMVDSLYNVVKNAQLRHFGKYQILGINVGAPEVDEQPQTFEGEVEKLKRWITLRLNWLDNNMLGDCNGEPPVELALGETFMVYPNPATSEINILAKDLIKQMQLFDFTGRQIYTSPSVFNKSFQINASALSKGVYILKIKGVDGKTSTQKVILK